MSENIEHNNYVVVKLITSEVIIGKVHSIEASSIRLINPLNVKIDDSNNEQAYYMTEYLPWADAPFFEIPSFHIISVNLVRKESLKFYGNALCQILIGKIRNESQSKCTGDFLHDYTILIDSLELCKKISDELSAEFDIAPIDFTDIEEKIQKLAPKFH